MRWPWTACARPARGRATTACACPTWRWPSGCCRSTRASSTGWSATAHRDWSEARAREAELLRRQTIDPAAAARLEAENEEMLDALLREIEEEGESEEAFGDEEEIAEEPGPANGPGPGRDAA